MNQENKPLSDEEKRRLESEIAKNEAEKKKLDLEAKEVEKRLGQRWCSTPVLAKWLVGGIVTAILITAWITAQFSPILRREHNIEKLDNRIRILEIELAAKEIEAQNTALQENLAQAEERAKELQAGFEKLRAEYSELSRSQSVSSNQRTEFADRSEIAKRDAESIKDDIVQLQNTRRQVDKRAQQIKPLKTPLKFVPVKKDS
jgi:chromosome segregation ATPase